MGSSKAKVNGWLLKKQLREKANIRLVHFHCSEKVGHELDTEEEINKEGSKAKVDGKKVKKRQWTLGVRETEREKIAIDGEIDVFAMELHSERKRNRSPVIEATAMGRENSQNETDESDSTYEKKEGDSGRSSSSVSLEDEASTSSGRLGGEMRSKKREDRGEREVRMQKGGRKGDAGQHGRQVVVQRVKGKGKAVADEAGEKVAEASVDVVIRHRCTLEAVCALNDELDDDRKRAIKDTVWSPVLEYRSFAMDGHPIRALIEHCNSNTKSFKIGRKEVPFSLYDVALITGLLAHGKPVLFQRSEVSVEVEGLLKGAIDDHVSHKCGKIRTLQKDMRIYRNYISVLLELYRSNNTRDKVGIFTKLYALLVVSGLLFPRCAGGVAWDLISMIDDAEATWIFLVEAIEEAKEKMCSARNVQINGFAMILQVWFYEHTNIYSFGDDKCVPRILSWVHLYKGKKYDVRLVVAAIQDSQVSTLATDAFVVLQEVIAENAVLEVREEERVKDVMRAFIDTDEYQGYVEDAEGVISLDMRLRRVRDVLRKEKEGHTVMKRELATIKKELAELRAMIQVGGGRTDVGREEVQVGDERVVEPGDGGASLVHYSESDDEATHEEGKLEASDVALGDTELRSDDVHNAMDVGHGTGDDGQHKGEIEGVTVEPIHGGVLGNVEGDESDGGLGKLLQLAMLSVKHTNNSHGTFTTCLPYDVFSLRIMLYTILHACEEELNLDAIVRVGRTVVEGVAVDALKVTTSRTEMSMDEQAGEVGGNSSRADGGMVRSSDEHMKVSPAEAADAIAQPELSPPEDEKEGKSQHILDGRPTPKAHPQPSSSEAQVPSPPPALSTVDKQQRVRLPACSHS
ncbi:hypothetical protein Cgig2_010631 [Carnegiea gigantea]|uniref:Aminotransferase-like plant mobile domain-containing protein n=1 Tax=Carnegiea gigantea TaxID=171969 RepID=A0A9Q1JL81_9CARY|nr:hypothetical protein Cgig2_010631 [Carnegiea gigantea]